MDWPWRKPDLSLSNEYQNLMSGGCINCHALLNVLREVNGYNQQALERILSKVPDIDRDESGCWSYIEYGRDNYPKCLSGLKDDDPKVIQARNEIIAARKAIPVEAERHWREQERELRRIKRRRLP
jgi:hypothetical protein